MGSRDYRHRETKKTKKDARKLPEVTVLKTPATVEVVKKKKKQEEEE